MLLTGQGGSERHHATEELGIGRIVQRRNVLLGDDQNVRRSLGRDVAKGDHLLVVHKGLRRNLTADDFAENAILGVKHWPASGASTPRRSRQRRCLRSQNVACSAPASQGGTPRQ